jgi:hypothetical protein
VLTLILAAALAAPPDAGWKFVDESTHDGRTVVSFRSVDLSGTPSRPLHADDKPPAGSRFGSVAIGPGSRIRLAVVWHASTNTLWFDADGDGRFSAAERVTLVGSKPFEAIVSIPFGGTAKQSRTVIIRKRGEGLAWAVRGYTIGSVAIAGKSVAAMLTDGDANGCFDDAGSDRIWLDLDRNGKFDALTEQFPLGKTISVAGAAVLIRPQPNGLGATVHERPKETGTLIANVLSFSKSDLIDFRATYVSEFGELIVLRNAGEAAAMPAGKYRLQSLTFRLAGLDGHLWSYVFLSTGIGGDVEVLQGRETTHRLLEELKLVIEADPASKAKPGESVTARPDVMANGLFLSKCEIGTIFATSGGSDAAALIELSSARGLSLDIASCGFA